MWSSLAFRETDRFVRDTFGVTPLSVSTDRLGLTALRASAIQARLRDAGQPMPRAGGGRIVEVYPVVALKLWRLAGGSYKGRNHGALSALVGALVTAAPWLDLGEYREACQESNDAFDALVAAPVARAHALGRWYRPPEETEEVAAMEGWIVVPECRLTDLLVS